MGLHVFSRITHLIYEIFQTAPRVEGRHQAGVVIRGVPQEAQIENRIYVRMMQRAQELHEYFPRTFVGREILEGHAVGGQR